ncbi:aminopeptidase N C-terminal domain-containing protein [Escherichia coli]|uniref:aminopeptidase N C-terminal domain-containing protein n=1 Tax=Escherichia coli TaxID=562 RepID=UPI000A9E29AF|nr:aminopeptidase N C-terminal domain-containing protein [Escherichia coli]
MWLTLSARCCWDEKIDPALAAEILTLPSVNEMAELFDIIDPIAIAEVREATHPYSGD